MRSICCVWCGDLHKLLLWKIQRGWSLETLGCAQAPKGIWPLAYSEGNHQLQSPNLADIWPNLTSEHPHNFPSENYCSVYILIAKTFLDLAAGSMALIFVAGCSYWLCKAKNIQSSLLIDQTRWDKPLSKHSREHCCRSTRVIYRGCRDIDSNS